jgi:streptogramin lyase
LTPATSPWRRRASISPASCDSSIPTAKSGAIGIAAGPNGNIWFCQNKGGKIGCLSPAGKVTEYRVAEDSEPFLIIAGPDGNMWFTDEKDRSGHIRIQAGEKRPKKK